MKFGYTILYVRDVEVTVEFYEKAFALERKFVHESGFAEMSTGETALAFASHELCKSNGVPVRFGTLQEPSPAVEIAFVTEDPTEAYARALRAGAVDVKPPTKKPWGQTVAYVRDLNGFLVEICSPVS